MHIGKRHYDVITVGETTVDAFMTIHNANITCSIDEGHNALCIKHGEKVEVDRYDFCLGGNATNVAVGLQRLGIRTALCSEIGDDEFSIKIRNWLAKEGIERFMIKQTTNGASSFAVVINFKGDRTLFVQDVERQHNFDFSEVTTPFVFLTSLGKEWKEPYQKVLDFVNENNCCLAFNPGHRQLREGKELVQEVLKKTNILFVNKEEAEMLLHDKESDEKSEQYMHTLLADLHTLGAKTVVITDGTNGSYVLSDEGKYYHHASGESKPVERTGAGDAFTTGFLAASLYGLSIPHAMNWGTQNASSVVAHIGAQAGLLNKEEMQELAHDHVDKIVQENKDEDEIEMMPAPLD